MDPSLKIKQYNLDDAEIFLKQEIHLLVRGLLKVIQCTPWGPVGPRLRTSGVTKSWIRTEIKGERRAFVGTVAEAPCALGTYGSEREGEREGG